MSVHTQATPKLRMPEKLGFGIFSASNNIVLNFKDLFYLFFLTNIMGISIAHAGIITAIGIVWDAINDPLVGFWAVNHKFKNGEKVRPFALWCAVPWAATMVLMFTSFNMAYGLKLAIAMILYFLFELFNTFVSIPYSSMASLATNRDDDRRAINVARNVGGCIGTGIGAVALYPLMNLFGGLDATGNIIPGDPGKRAFLLAAMVMGILCVVGCLAHYFTTRERIKSEETVEEKIGLIDAFKMLFACRSWVMNTLYVLCYAILNLLVLSTLNYFATYVLGASSSATLIMAVYLVMSLIFSILSVPIDKKLGRRNTMISAAVVYAVGKIWFVINPCMASVMVNAISVAYAATVAFVEFSTNRNNIVDIIEWKDHHRLDSLVSTCDNLIVKLSKAGASLLMTSALAASGFNAELAVQPASAINAINGFLGWVPMCFALLMVLVAIFHPIEKETAAMLADKD